MTGAVTKVRENGATSGLGLLATYTYDDLGRRDTITRGNGVSTDFDYDAISRLDSLVQDLSGSSNDQSLTFSYNPADQIASRTVSNDAYAWTNHANGNTATVVNGLNQIDSAGGVSFSYDARGKLTSDGSTSYGFDADNRLTSASGGATFDYDALGRLYESDATGVAATRFLYDGSNLVAEYNTSGTLQRRFVHGPRADEPLVWYEGSGTSDRRWLITDERGSVIAVTDDAGDPIAINAYDEYGQPDANNVGRFQYTGQAWIEAAGLYYYKTRFYSPAHGRFLQTDSIGYSAGLNLYAYVNHDPINRIDPRGTDETIPEVIVTAESNPATGSCGRSGELCSLRAAAEAAAAALEESYDAWRAEMSGGGDLASGGQEQQEQEPQPQEEEEIQCTPSSLSGSIARNTTWSFGGGLGLGGRAFGKLNIELFHAYGGWGGNFAGRGWGYTSGGGPALVAKFRSLRVGFSTGGGETRWNTANRYFEEQSETAFAGWSTDAGTLEYGNRLHGAFLDVSISPDLGQIWRDWRCGK